MIASTSVAPEHLTHDQGANGLSRVMRLNARRESVLVLKESR
jgi:hypothetical protein